MKEFIRKISSNYGKVKLVVHRNSFYVESPFKDELLYLLESAVISEARVKTKLNEAKSDIQHLEKLDEGYEYEDIL